MMNFENECKDVAAKIASALASNLIVGPGNARYHLSLDESEYLLYYVFDINDPNLSGLVIRLSSGRTPTK